MRESIPVIDPVSKSSPTICERGGVLRAAAVLAIASATIWRSASAVRISWSSSRSPLPFLSSPFRASFHSRRLIAGNPRLRARATMKWPDNGCWTKIRDTSLGSYLISRSPAYLPTSAVSAFDQ
jgi:hypothetical protein